ncbi:MAG: translation initiation factor IF-2 N-terminal domain-containing protein, partial [Oscillospiraceae bacterium]|nr:translation initiation factor IF-2 N-terminal domain-containing protein [Oscillospiraceae bacterium]
MPREKYRVHEVAKDFGINSKKILEILDGNSPEPRKHMTALEDAELDLIFDTITKENEVESFDEYFAAGEREKAEKQAAKETAEEEKTEEAEETPTEEPKKAEKAAKKPKKKDEPKKEKAPAAA